MRDGADCREQLIWSSGNPHMEGQVHVPSELVVSCGEELSSKSCSHKPKHEGFWLFFLSKMLPGTFLLISFFFISSQQSEV